MVGLKQTSISWKGEGKMADAKILDAFGATNEQLDAWEKDASQGIFSWWAKKNSRN